GHLRALSGGAEGRSEDAGIPGGGARGAEEGPRVPPQGRRLHLRRDRGVDRHQGGEGAEPGAAAAVADGVRALLRYLTAAGLSLRSPREYCSPGASLSMRRVILLLLIAACTPARTRRSADPRALRGVKLGVPVPADARPTPGIGCG